MTKLSQTPPLRVILMNKMKQVTIHINEPLLPKKINKKVRQEIYLLQQFGQLEILLEKKNRLEVWKSKGGLRTADATIKDLDHKISIIQRNLEPLSLLLKVKEEASLYPNARQHLFKETESYLTTTTADNNNIGEQYQLEHLHQLYATACRLYHDLRLTDHKYIVYQLALLYQCINRQGVTFIEYKGRIEQRFNEIATYSKKSDNKAVHLDIDQITWLQSLCLDIVMQVTDYNSVIKCSEIFSYIYSSVVT